MQQCKGTMEDLEQKLEQHAQRITSLLTQMHKRGATQHLRTSIHSGFQFMQAIADSILDTVEEIEKTNTETQSARNQKATRDQSQKIKISDDLDME